MGKLIDKPGMCPVCGERVTFNKYFLCPVCGEQFTLNIIENRIKNKLMESGNRHWKSGEYLILTPGSKNVVSHSKYPELAISLARDKGFRIGVLYYVP